MERLNLSKRKGGNYYFFYLDETGRRRGKSTGKKTKSEALKYLSEFQKAYKSKSRILLKSALESFLDYSKSNHSPGHYEDYKVKLSRLLQHTGNVELTKITVFHVQDFINSILVKSKPLANKTLTLIKSFFNYAVNQDLIQVNPCNRIKKIKLPEKQPLYFSESELLLTISHISNSDLKDVVIWAVNTGMRLSEIINLRWNQIDLSAETVLLDNQNSLTKSKKVRAIPLNTTAINLIKKRMTGKGDYVFTIAGQRFKKDYICHSFKKAVRAAGVNPLLHFHSLRHTFASYLVKQNIPIFSVSKLLGHSNVKTTEIYSHLQPEQLKKEVETININFN